MPANILNLPSLKVTQLDETDYHHHIKAQASTDSEACSECRHISLVGFGRNGQMIKDLFMHGKRLNAKHSIQTQIRIIDYTLEASLSHSVMERIHG